MGGPGPIVYTNVDLITLCIQADIIAASKTRDGYRDLRCFESKFAEAEGHGRGREPQLQSQTDLRPDPARDSFSKLNKKKITGT